MYQIYQSNKIYKVTHLDMMKGKRQYCSIVVGALLLGKGFILDCQNISKSLSLTKIDEFTHFCKM